MTDVPADREFWTGVLRHVIRRTKDHPDAEDLLHSAFLRLARYGKKVDDPGAFLVHTALNLNVDEYRRQQLTEGVAADLAKASGCQAPLPDEVVAARARLARAKAGLDQLPSRTREIYLMHRLEDLKYREIAERLDISESAVEKHIAKALLFLTRWVAGW